MPECKVCGLSEEGVYENIGLGIDEEPRFVICKCNDINAVNKRAGLLDECFEYASACISTLTVDNLSESINDYSDNCYDNRLIDVTKTPFLMEYEITLDRNLTEILENSVPWFEDEHSYTEVGYASLAYIKDRKGGSRVVNGKVRNRFSTMTESTLKIEIKKTNALPGIVYSVSQEFVIEEVPYNSCSSLNDAYEQRVLTKIYYYNPWKFVLRYYDGGKSKSCEIEYESAHEPKERDFLSFVEYLYSSFLAVPSLRRYMSYSHLSMLRSSNLPTKDISEPISGNFIYRVKVDGENNWLVDGGCVWFLARNDRDLSVVGYITKSTVTYFTPTPTVLRVEALSDGRLVFIDVLSIEKNVTPITRSVRSSYESVKRIDNLPSGIIYRKDFNSFKAICEEIKTTLIPNDGILIINRSTSRTYRLKPPTLDLKVLSGYLCTIDSDYHYIRKAKAHKSMREGLVYECNVCKGPTGKEQSLRINKFHLRHDKMMPNQEKVYRSIKRIASTRGNKRLVFSEEVSSYSFEVRAYLYEYADLVKTSGALIIDVGVGRGQSMSIINERKSSTWLFIDPNISDKFISTLGYVVNCTDYDSRSMVNLLKDLNRGKVGKAVYKGRVENLISIKEVHSYITANRTPLVYAFSASYCIDTINLLKRWNVPQVGCMFMYDSTDKNGFVFNVFGLYMRIMRETTNTESKFIGIACLGDGAKFKEDPITKEDFESVLVVDSSERIPIEQYSDECRKVIKHISIFC